MDMSIFQDLGERVSRRYRAVNCDESRLSEIACEELDRTSLPTLDLTALTNFVTDGGVPQRPDETFGDLPAVVYTCPEFYIQLLVWNHSTTSVHEHAFSGAFKVLAGSSIHSRYRFEVTQPINAMLRLGAAKWLDSELLTAGSVRPIIAGHDTPMHALYHLEHPSATVVVRNYGVASAQPQYAFAKPHFAYASHVFDRDAGIRMLRKGLRVMAQADLGALHAYLVSEVPRLDINRIFGAREEIDRYLGSGDGAAAFQDALRSHHPAFADCFMEVLAASRREVAISSARVMTEDPEHRFFLAALLNAPTRDALLGLVQARYPEATPETKCAQLLVSLSDPNTLLDSMIKQRQRAGSDSAGVNLLQRLAQLMPKTGVLAQGVASAVAHDCVFDWAALAREAPESGFDASALSDIAAAVSALPELSALQP